MSVATKKARSPTLDQLRKLLALQGQLLGVQFGGYTITAVDYLDEVAGVVHTAKLNPDSGKTMTPVRWIGFSALYRMHPEVFGVGKGPQ